MKTTTCPEDKEKWVLQICERSYRRRGKCYEIWQTISRPLIKSTAMSRLDVRKNHPKPHRILAGVAEAEPMHSVLREVVA